GLLLPQVALERGWTPLRFLEETCRKAGLPPDSWKAGVRLEAFQADVFGEKSLAGGPPGGPHSSSTMSPTAASDRL
ncbi:MAG TPA: AMMECR1 domain-containing protein, partial [Terriglobia bacterium]|nr:AMMECR1 domain-containing protein [Terriglobia bacterium]